MKIEITAKLTRDFNFNNVCWQVYDLWSIAATTSWLEGNITHWISWLMIFVCPPQLWYRLSRSKDKHNHCPLRWQLIEIIKCRAAAAPHSEWWHEVNLSRSVKLIDPNAIIFRSKLNLPTKNPNVIDDKICFPCVVAVLVAGGGVRCRAGRWLLG